MEASSNHPKKILQLGNDLYVIQQLHAKELSSLAITKDKISVRSQERFCCGQMYKGQLYLFSGTSSSNVPPNQKLHSFSLETKKTKQINIKQPLENGYYYCSSILNNQMYVFGGKEYGFTLSPLVGKINLSTGYCQKIISRGDLPSSREQPLMQSINDMFIVIYGGINPIDAQIFSDAFIFTTNEWKKLKIINQIEPRVNFSYASIGNKIYIHGGRKFVNEQPIYFYQMHQVHISEVALQMKFEQIQYTSAHPQARSNHAMTPISQRYLFICGGQGKQNNLRNRSENNICNDAWIFDIFEREWVQVKVMPNELNLKINPILKCNKNQIIIFGGTDNQGNQKYEYSMFQFPRSTTNLNFGKQILSQIVYNKQKQIHGDNISMSVNLAHSVAFNMKFPFQPIQRIIELIQLIKSPYVNIYSQMTTNTLDKYVYLSFQFQGGLKFLHVQKEKNQISKIKQKQITLEYNNLIYYGLRLGKTILQVEHYRQKQLRYVRLVSCDSRFSPLIDTMLVQYHYIENLKSGFITSLEGKRHKYIIMNVLKTFVEDPNDFISNVKQSKITVFSLNVIPTSKTYFYQIIFEHDNDITIFKNTKKIEYLQRIKYEILKTMEFSLNNYLKFSRSLLPDNNQKQNSFETKIFISSSKQQIPFSIPYRQYLKSFFNNGKLSELNINTSSLRYVKFIKLYMCQYDFILPENNGILIYHSGNLVNRYEDEFGQLMTEKFYKKKYYNQPSNIYQVVGQIHVSQQLKLTNFKTQFQNSKRFLNFRTSITNAINQAIKQFKKFKIKNGNLQKKTNIGKESHISIKPLHLETNSLPPQVGQKNLKEKEVLKLINLQIEQAQLQLAGIPTKKFKQMEVSE